MRTSHAGQRWSACRISATASAACSTLSPSTSVSPPSWSAPSSPLPASPASSSSPTRARPTWPRPPQQAHDALGADHAPQREGTPTEKATVERGFGTIKNALTPILDLLNRLAGAVPSLRQPVLAQHVITLLVATFLRVYAAGRRHLGHPLDGHDPDVLRVIIEQQRDQARAEDRSVRLFLEAVHAEYAMPTSRDAFVRTFRRYPLEDLKDAERRFRAHACRCQVRVCDRYFAAVVRDVHDRNRTRRAAERAQRRAEGEQRRSRAAALQRAAQLDAHPDILLYEASTAALAHLGGRTLGITTLRPGRLEG